MPTANPFPSLRALALGTILATAAMGAGAADAPFVLAYTDGQIAQSYVNLQTHHASLSAVGLGSTYALQPDGRIDSSAMTPTTANIIRFARGKGLPVYPTVSDYSNSYRGFDPAVSNAVLKDAASRANAVANLVALAHADDFAGINIDLEAVQPGMKTQLSGFIHTLADALHRGGKKLIISIPAKSGDREPSYLDGYDYAALGSAVDYFQVMTYDEVGPGWSSSPSGTWPGPQAGLDWMKTKLAYAVSRVPSAKILQGLPAYGYDYSTGKQAYWKGTNGTPGYNDILGARNVTRLRDGDAATPYATWGTVTPQPDGTGWDTTTRQPVLWYDDAQSIGAKASLVGAYKLAGTSVWAMGYEDAGFWSAVATGLRVGGGDTGGTIGTAGAGYVWKSNARATDNGNRVATAAVHDGSVNASVTLNTYGEGGSRKWQAAGIVFPAARTVSSVTFVNGVIDTHGNGFFESGVTLQYTTDGVRWLESGWAVSQAYPGGAAAADQSYTFTGALTGVLGVRVSGRTGPTSWSGAVKEIRVQGL
ncbi:glycosyl hydrolase family 18 protein [Pseudoduganella plicata]|uniref:GH18 domain-containing protein n=1 Tax=Pseudoduganella plicata TaxID=321984 RepID=A0A4P7B9C7_9BURK|nr:glycosyl hydrolase family 18 protein [Pseudoduganella plicata]QBQ35131.1 hypothetical protein E1742_02305 [Pseudoduganella plicata]GGZ05650.1 hypothetical protein GCM10007388_44240 [Pseudoduganella plicata]